MAAITQQRLAELQQLYTQLKERILQVDAKYGLEYREPELNMPESLNLKELTYTPKSESELRQTAAQQVAATIISKQRSIDSSYSSKLKSLSADRTRLQQKYSEIYTELRSTYIKNYNNLTRKLINNGLLFSSVSNTARDQELATFNANTAAATKKENEESALLDTEEENIERAYSQACASLQKEQAALIEKAYLKLKQDDEQLKNTIDKYNNSLEEKEQKYQASRAKALLSAQRAEDSRLQTALKAYAQLGDAGFRDMICKQKYVICQDAFWPLRRNEAQAILGFDSFLRTHLDTYYSLLEDWINTSLLPPNN